MEGLSLHVGMRSQGKARDSQENTQHTGCYSGAKHQLKSESLRGEALVLSKSLLEMQVPRPKV